MSTYIVRRIGGREDCMSDHVLYVLHVPSYTQGVRRHDK